MGFVENEQRACRIEAGLLVKQTAISRREDIVVISDPDVVEREGGAGDLIRADPGIATGGSKRIEIAGMVFDSVKSGQSTGAPTLFHIFQIGATFAHTMKGVVHAMLGFIAHMPRSHGSACLCL